MGELVAASGGWFAGGVKNSSNFPVPGEDLLVPGEDLWCPAKTIALERRSAAPGPLLSRRCSRP